MDTSLSQSTGHAQDHDPYSYGQLCLRSNSVPENAVVMSGSLQPSFLHIISVKLQRRPCRTSAVTCVAVARTCLAMAGSKEDTANKSWLGEPRHR